MAGWKKFLKWIYGAIGILLLSADRLSNMIGKSTTPEDAQSLLEKVGKFLDWLTVHDSAWVLFIGMGLLAVSSALIYADLRNWLAANAAEKTKVAAPTEKPHSAEAALIEAQAKLAHENRMADKLTRTVMEPLHKVPAQAGTFFSPTVTMSDPPPFKPENVYVSKITIDADKAKSENIVTFRVTCFNGSGNGIFLHRPKGNVSASAVIRGASKSFEPLPVPYLQDGRQLENIKPSTEFVFSLEQTIPKSVAAIISGLAVGSLLSFDLSQLEVVVGPIRWPQEVGRIFLWDGVGLYRNAKQFHHTKIVAVTATAKSRTKLV